ncbi:CPBP family intramembrane glutamic endopeptidase [Microbacterium sp. B2969]|uniref:CPBP family intramembrane glutamic endopeptidase n=1 Tax=Microbacterium alkaliflavum TaxID=3248839 RepID=A0ABW7Q7Q0_9MICO
MTDSEQSFSRQWAPRGGFATEAMSVPPRRSRRATEAVAWTVTVATSTIPVILWMQFTGRSPAWLPWAQVAVAALIGISSIWWVPARPLWRFALSMAILTVLVETMPQLASAVQPFAQAAGQPAFVSRMIVEQGAKLIGAAFMICLLLLLGLHRRQFYLSVGDLDARIRPVPLLGFPRADRWARFGLIWGVGIAAVLFAVEWLVFHPTGAQLVGMLPMIPAIVLFAALNAFSEEMTYRAPMIATLGPAVDARSALWQSAFFFGVAHYFGVPGGMMGAVAAIFMGWILGKAMIETRGLFWPWLIHVLSDIAIFTFIAMAMD